MGTGEAAKACALLVVMLVVRLLVANFEAANIPVPNRHDLKSCKIQNCFGSLGLLCWASRRRAQLEVLGQPAREEHLAKPCPNAILLLHYLQYAMDSSHTTQADNVPFPGRSHILRLTCPVWTALTSQRKMTELNYELPGSLRVRMPWFGLGLTWSVTQRPTRHPALAEGPRAHPYHATPFAASPISGLVTSNERCCLSTWSPTARVHMHHLQADAYGTPPAHPCWCTPVAETRTPP